MPGHPTLRYFVTSFLRFFEGWDSTVVSRLATAEGRRKRPSLFLQPRSGNTGKPGTSVPGSKRVQTGEKVALSRVPEGRAQQLRHSPARPTHP
jgi:hypothetical protein